MARRRRRMTGARATAFAGGEIQGKSTGWESLLNADLPVVQSTAFPTSAFVAGNDTTRFVTLVPINVTRGNVTLLRVRGQLATFFELEQLKGTETAWRSLMMLQLVPARDGAILADAVLSAANAADLESNRILWRHTFWPESTDFVVFDIDDIIVSKGIEVDVKSKRRFDRATWALVLSLTSTTASQDDHFFAGNLRGYFKSGDAL